MLTIREWLQTLSGCALQNPVLKDESKAAGLPTAGAIMRQFQLEQTITLISCFKLA